MPESNKPKGSLTRKGFYSPAPGKLSKAKKEKLANTYAGIREKQGGSESKAAKEKAAKIAWSKVNDFIKDAFKLFDTYKRDSKCHKTN